MDIRAFRRRIRLTGRELADRLGVNQTAVIRLGISLDELFGPELGARNGEALRDLLGNA